MLNNCLYRIEHQDNIWWVGCQTILKYSLSCFKALFYQFFLNKLHYYLFWQHSHVLQCPEYPQFPLISTTWFCWKKINRDIKLLCSLEARSLTVLKLHFSLSRVRVQKYCIFVYILDPWSSFYISMQFIYMLIHPSTLLNINMNANSTWFVLFFTAFAMLRSRALCCVASVVAQL